MAARPGLQQVDQQQQRERDHQHHHRHRGGAGVVVLLQLGIDHQRRDLGNHRHVARDKHHRAVLAGGARERQRKPGQQRRQDRRQDHAAEGLQPVGAEAGRGLFQFLLDIFEHRLHRAHHERQADKGQRHHHAQRRERDLDAERFEVAADPAIAGEQRGQRDARHRGRQRERQVDQRIDQALADKAIAHQHPCHDQPEHRIDDGRDQRRAEAQLQRCHHARRRDRGPERVPRHRERLQERGRQRHQHDQRQVEQGEPERQAEARQHGEALRGRPARGGRGAGLGRAGRRRRRRVCQGNGWRHVVSSVSGALPGQVARSGTPFLMTPAHRAPAYETDSAEPSL
ncbi:conserved hypothetical protein [Cupriavidus taiwanensis]|uniref:Uncharacterized protein n=1 Tax=Cupriavidus taiwanensis TaxID=164546 RepID=A0A975ZZG2_9BURK|nr:conserved hypothetical protein [Cupriavidus taiwanensis]